MQINSRKISLLGVLIVILFLFLVIFSINFFGFFEKNEVEAVASRNLLEDEELHINQNPIDLDSVLLENKGEQATYEMVSEEIDLEYTTTYTENDELPSGTFHVTQVRNWWASRGYYYKKIHKWWIDFRANCGKQH